MDGGRRTAGAVLRPRRPAQRLIEALACGTRVVSTDCPSGPREILRGELARGLVPCNDARTRWPHAMRAALLAPRPDADVVAAALAPYDADQALDAWEALAREIA
jgi:glycosyltransferase involved in cell wall biosynthesis